MLCTISNVHLCGLRDLVVLGCRLNVQQGRMLACLHVISKLATEKVAFSAHIMWPFTVDTSMQNHGPAQVKQ